MEMRKGNPGSCVLVFDIGGVLIDWDPRYLYRAFFDGDSRSMEEFFEAIDFRNWNAEMDRGRPFAEAVAEWSARFPRRARLIEAFDERWEETVGGPIQGSVRILRRLKAAGFPLFGLTNSSPEKFKILRKKFQFLDCFQWIMISGEFGVIKPEPLIFDLFLARTGLRNEDCIYIDDSEANVSSALSMGWRAIHFRSPGQLAGELKTLGFDINPPLARGANRKRIS